MKPMALVGSICGLAIVLGTSAATVAAPITVRYTEGVTRGFPVLRSTTGDKLAQGEFTQVAQGDLVRSRLIFHFRDGSLYDESLVFSQRGVFTLMSYRLVQRGPSFPETIEATLDRESERYEVRYKSDEDSPEEILKGRFAIPADAYNGMLSMLMKNMAGGRAEMVHIVAFTPKPFAVKMQLAPVATDPVLVGDSPVRATRFDVRPQLGLFASLLVSDIPDIHCWILEGEAPGFLRFEGPLYFMGPIWRIDPN
jgi:hypothetical protein